MTQRLTSGSTFPAAMREGATADKHNKGFTRFSRRGTPACRAEWALHHIAKNLQK